MDLIYSLRLAVVVPLSLLIPQSPAKAAPSLAEAIEQADAKYLEVPDIEGEDTGLSGCTRTHA